MERRSIYNKRNPKHPHSPVRCYERRPKVPPPWIHYMEFFPSTVRIYATIRQHIRPYLRLCHSHDVTISMKTLPPHQELSGIRHYCHHWHWKFCSSHYFLLDLTHNFQLYSTEGFWCELTYGLRFNLTQSFLSNFTHI